jgi:cytochrome o ubiquinol oxidase subunit 2
MCAHEMMAIDAGDGPGRTGEEALQDRRVGDLRGRRYVPSAMCASTDAPAAGLNTALSRLAP